jgi:hypothetical protein
MLTPPTRRFERPDGMRNAPQCSSRKVSKISSGETRARRPGSTARGQPLRMVLPSRPRRTGQGSINAIRQWNRYTGLGGSVVDDHSPRDRLGDP